MEYKKLALADIQQAAKLIRSKSEPPCACHRVEKVVSAIKPMPVKLFCGACGRDLREANAPQRH